MPTQSQMLQAIHKANPKTLNQRFNPQQLAAAFAKLGGGAAAPVAGVPVPVTAQQVGQTQNTLANTSAGIAQGQLQSGAVSEPFSFQSDDAARQRVEEAAYGRLTRGVDDRFARDTEQAKQDLANRGIQYDPNPESRYQQELRDLNTRYDTIKNDARQNATYLGGQEMQNNYNIAAGTYNTRLGGIDTTSKIGLGGSVAFEQLSQADKDRLMQMAITKLQLKNRGGGGGVTPEDPFSSSGPPGL